MTEEMGYKVTYTERNMSVITTSLALLVLHPDPRLFGGLAFGITSYNRGVYLKIRVQENPFKKALASVFLPKSLKNFIGIKYSDPDKRSKIQFKFFGTTSLFLDDSLMMERLYTYVVSASIEKASIQNLNELVTVTLHHIDQKRDDSLMMERLYTYVVSASIEKASIQNLNELVTVTLHHIDQKRIALIPFGEVEHHKYGIALKQENGNTSSQFSGV
ncbi:hypothetical protein HGM15179_020334 [Zosterops borbonicus]|uniref:Uncharacterized protein n=1 Tax=Zosterops borbonicus TaxID=364589 RepID=A0A8K1FXP5_9PASS|nr:hypothetical protein HGM15179_020334 [Zosterops borbonicus]